MVKTIAPNDDKISSLNVRSTKVNRAKDEELKYNSPIVSAIILNRGNICNSRVKGEQNLDRMV